MLELNDHHLKALIVIVGLGNLRSQPTLHSGPKAQAEEPYCRGQSHAQHLTKRLEKRTNSVQGQDKGESCQYGSTESCV